jgi:hypothetical protein
MGARGIQPKVPRHQKRSSGGLYQGLSVFLWVGLVLLTACSKNAASSEVGSATHARGPLPVELHRDPGSTSVTRWPVTLGVPFREGALHPSTELGIVDDQGQLVPAQVERIATWGDGSVRWVRVSFVQPFTRGRTYYLDKPTRLSAYLKTSARFSTM